MENFSIIPPNPRLGKNDAYYHGSKYLPILTMVQITIMLSTLVLIYKIIGNNDFRVSAATLVNPFWYLINDSITEVYGYSMGRRIIWASLACELLFALICTIFINLPSPPDWLLQQSFTNVFGSLFRVCLGSFSAILLGSFINIYALSKWKILLRGHYFWLRSLGSTGIGELFFTVIAFAIEFVGKAPASQIIELIIVSYLFKMVFAGFAIYPISKITLYLKKAEGIDIYDTDINFNPFKFNL